LLKAERIPESRKQISNYYAHALALVHYCHFQPGMQEKFSQYLSMVGGAMSIDLAFSKAFERDYKIIRSQNKNSYKKKQLSVSTKQAKGYASNREK